MGRTIHFFVGANSGGGFRNLFPEIMDPETDRDFLILKGGPGVGKSTFLKAVGQAAEAAGLDVEYLWCSGDPDSLDGVRVPALGYGAADGTSPHVLEPRYPAAADRYVDLGRFYDVDALKSEAAAVREHTKAYQSAYVRAYRALNAARQVELDAFARAVPDRERMERRLRGLLLRELRRRGPETGRTTRRFLGSVTWKGNLWRFDSVEVLCPRVYAFEDTFGFAGTMLERLHDAAASRGWDSIVCLSPEDPSRMEHLLIPGLGAAFITSRPGMEYGSTENGSTENSTESGPERNPSDAQRTVRKPFRRIRLDALAEISERPRLKLETRMVSLLRAEGVQALREAHEAHDRLEAVYNPHVDFDGVRALAKREAERMLSYRER